MKVTVATLSDSVFTLDVGEDLEIENFRVSIGIKKTIRIISFSRLSVKWSLVSRVQRSVSCLMDNLWWT